MYRLLGVGTAVKARPFHREQGWLLVITFLIGALCKKCIKIIVIRDCAREKKSRISFGVRAEIQPRPLFCVTTWAHRFAWSSKVLFKHLCFRHCSQSWRLIVIATGIHPSNSSKYKYHLSFFFRHAFNIELTTDVEVVLSKFGCYLSCYGAGCCFVFRSHFLAPAVFIIGLKVLPSRLSSIDELVFSDENVHANFNHSLPCRWYL